jgi:hypothetical protein
MNHSVATVMVSPTTNSFCGLSPLEMLYILRVITCVALLFWFNKLCLS